MTVSGLTGVTSIAVGDSFACAVRSDGTVWCWGNNTGGQLGVGTTSGPNQCVFNSVSTTCSTIPAAVGPLGTGGVGAKAVTVGTDFACALLSDGFTVQCWGDNDASELGIGEVAGPSGACSPAVYCSASPLTVSGL